MFVEETIEKYEKYLNPAMAKLFRFMGLASVETNATGWIIKDSEGREFIDCLGGYGMFCLGHRHPQVIAAVKEALNTMPMCGEVLFNRPMADLAEALAKIAPGNLQYSFFVNSGTEAVEGALKLARLATGRQKYIAANNAFHGKTYGSLTATGRDLFRKPFEPLLQNFTHVEFGNIGALEAVIDEQTAAVILEPIQGEGGIIVPPTGYLKAVRELCDRYGVLFIADEVQTGIGRTGKWFGVNHEGVTPDIMALAKALGGGVAPIGAFTATPEVWQGLIDAPFLHTSTFGGNQLACSAALATLRVIEEEDLLAKGTIRGKHLLKGLKEIANLYPSVIKEIRGRGMMIGIELTKEGAGGMLMSLLIDKNILIAYTLNNPKVIRMEPPLIMPEEVIDHVLMVLEDAIKTIAECIDEL
ncbi:MAG TPA: aminotransferase class III-fold pyridoxal phosphate-dependent enzyme [Candidatus Avacidaminococcus intestinavium]|uniref:Aminotransferase class III-fold pyridoxal phosphate-dependent enzyme n=1 Tax=Candidatus Avacidaminococcus intestinavium TaxID=2840684 RepID=A0A9D1MQL2_9FIRM|nr:aminotransferase class III-fold pyridoxal phosphate-dependent enzyme [Candidatus Avacidaminococcus intestinavium]